MKTVLIDLEIHMKPIAKGRPRLGKDLIFTPKRTRNAEEIIAWEILSHMKKNGITVTQYPVSVELQFCYERPRRVVSPYPRVADVDNLAKLCLDAMNKIVYVDDTQVIFLGAEKMYYDEDKVVIKVTEIK